MNQLNPLSLPNSWEIHKLNELCKIGDGNHSSNYPKSNEMVSEGVPFIRANNMVNGEVVWSDLKFITTQKHEILKKGHLRTGDILFTNRGEIGKIAIVGKDFNNANLNSQIAWFRCLEKINNRFLFYFLASPSMQNHYSIEKNGAALQQFTIRQINGIEIPLPPLTEQQRIVAILDDAFAKIEKAKANAVQNLKNAKEVFESYLQGVFENKGDDWEEITLGEVCKISSKLIDPKISEYQDLIHIGAGNIESKKGTLIDLKTAKEENLISGKFLFDESMILYSKIRPYLMKVVNCEFQGLCSADIYPLVSIKEKMTKDFLYHLLLTKDFTDYAILGSQRAGMPKVNREHLFAYRFDLPPIKEQKTIVQKLDGLSAETKKIEEVYEQKICDLKELKKSVLQKAFSGELKIAEAIS
jgi:type I restriction enzyme S subunit